MFDQSIDQNILPEVLRISSMRSIALGRWPRAEERIELYPAPRGKYSGLFTPQTLNNCILFSLFNI